MQSKANARGAKAAAEWEADAIEKCRNDPWVIAAGLCPVCMCNHPCLCDDDIITREMRAYFERNPKGDFERAKSRSWGAWNPIDELMTGLLIIAEDGLKAATEHSGIDSGWRHKNGSGKPEEPIKSKEEPIAYLNSSKRVPLWRRWFNTTL